MRMETTITSCMPISISKHPEVVENLDQWADWLYRNDWCRRFPSGCGQTHRLLLYEEFHPQYYPKYGEDFYVFAEFWNGDTETNDEYLESIDYLYDLVDVALHRKPL